MSLIIGMAVLGAIGMCVIWAPAYPAVEPRHEHMRAMDALRGPAEDPFPHGWCLCGNALDERGNCTDQCARDSWDRP